MIKICMDRRRFRVTISGHAGYGPVGADIVCAGASVLSAALARALWDVDGYSYSDDGEVMEISCAPTPAQAGRVLTVMDTVGGGFALLAGSYPGHVRLITDV